MEEMRKKIEDLIKKQEELDERLQAVEIGKEEFNELKRTSIKIHEDLKELKEDNESRYQETIAVYKDTFNVITENNREVMGFKKEREKARGDWIVAVITAMGGGATIAIIIQWILSL